MIKGVRIYGVLGGSGWQGKNFKVEIWDKGCQVLNSAIYPVTKFPVKTPSWVEVNVPSVKVTDKFYVHVYTGTGRMMGIHLGADDSVVNKHSGLTFRTEDGTIKISTRWPYPTDLWFGDKSKVNWMIRVIGQPLE